MKAIEGKIPSITGLATTAGLNAKLNEAKGEITSITALATTPPLSAVERKIADVSTLVEKQMIKQKQKKLRVNISPHWIIINIRKKCLIQR